MQLLLTLAKLNTDAGEQLLKAVVPKVKQVFSTSKNDYMRGVYYDLMVFLYDSAPEFRQTTKSALVRGLSDKSKLIR